MGKNLYAAASKYATTKRIFIVSESDLETVKKENPSFKYIYKLNTNLGEGKEYEVNLYSLQKEITPSGIVVSKKVKVTVNFQASSPEEIFNYLKQGTGTSWEKMTEDGGKIIYYSKYNLFEGSHRTLFQIEIIPC